MSGAADALAAVTAALPAAEDRPGQREMAVRVDHAIGTGRHLVVQAGTGTGKTLGYLVPAVLSGKKVVVSTATKALQDQLATKDLPFLARHLGHEFEWAVLKGRSNYLCLQRVREVTSDQQGQLEMAEMAATTTAEIRRLATWAGRTSTGDQADLEWAPSDRAWQALSVGSDECPGATRCPMGDACFSEGARRRAAAAQVVVVNTHLYGLDVAAQGALLGPHDVVVFDEAHLLEDVMSDTVGVAIGPGRFTFLTASLKRIVDDPKLLGAVAELAPALRDALSPHLGKRVGVPLPDAISAVLADARRRLDEAAGALRAIDTAVDDARQRKIRAQQLTIRLIEHVDVAQAGRDDSVAFVSGGPDHPRLEVAPLDVAPVLAREVWSARTAVLTSATLPAAVPRRVGLPVGGFDTVDVGSPFDYGTNALLYCGLHLPDPRAPGHPAAVADELVALLGAAGGRTLALFTSYRAMDAAAAAVRDRVDLPVITQRDMPKPALLRTFAADESTSLFATSGFFQGVDVPGRTLSLVVIDRLPFPRPDDPLLSARRERLGATAFVEIDVPRAATLLAQATGRLIRTATDRGVVAVLDRRLGTASYRWDIVQALPAMRRTRDRAEAERFLADITG